MDRANVDGACVAERVDADAVSAGRGRESRLCRSSSHPVQPGLLSTADVTMTYTISDRAVKTLAALALLGALGACSDARTPSAVTPLEPTTTHPVTPVAHLRGTLDVATGTLTFDPVSPSGASLASGPSTAIYGNQGLNVQIYNSAVVTSAPVAGKKTYAANVGVRNK